MRGSNELAPDQPSPSPPLPWKRRGDPARARLSKNPRGNMSSAKIHPTAIVDPAAEIGVDVEIGPFSIVGPQVTIGEKTIVQSHVVIEGDITIGSGNFIGHGALIGAAPQDVSFSPDRKTKVEIGNNVVIANNCLLAGYVCVDDGAFLGGGSTFHQFMRIGRLVMVQGSSAFGKDLPPFVIAAERNQVFGLNVVGLRRAGFSTVDRDEIKAAFKLVYLTGLNISQVLDKAATLKFGKHAREFLDFVADAKKRGICPFKRGSREDTPA